MPNVQQATLPEIKDFLNRCASTVYDEPSNDFTKQVRAEGWKRFMECAKLPPRSKILDIGSGNGDCLMLMDAAGMVPFGLVCSLKEFDKLQTTYRERAFFMDMHDLNQIDTEFDAVYACHVLEHSPIPLFLLEQIHSCLRLNGWLYVEVPGPDTSSRHWTNPNHYSCFQQHVWAELIYRAGFGIQATFEIKFQTELGDDVYYSYIAQCR